MPATRQATLRRRGRACGTVADPQLLQQLTALQTAQAIHRPASARPVQMLHLQRTAGNAAVTNLVVQRGRRGVNTEEVGFSAQGNVATGMGLGSAMPQVVDFRNTSYTPGAGATGVGATGVAVGGLGTVTKLALSSRQVHKLRMKLKDPHLDPLERKAIIRELKSAGVDVGEKAVGMLSHGVDAAAVALPSVGAVGAAAGGVAAPLQAFSVVREGRKLVKQQGRINKLERMLNDWNVEPQKKLNAQRDLVAAQQAKLDQADRVIAEAMREWVKAGKDLNALDKEPEYAKHVLAKQQAAAGLKAAQDRQALLITEKQKMEDAIKKEASGKPSLQTIQAYATRKNKRGIWKKLVGMIGGTLGVAGSISLAVAAGAGAAALMATPVGWALAATAAAVGIGVGIYKLVKWFKKRGKPDKRAAYAERLFELGQLGDDQGREARRLILALVNKTSLGLKSGDFNSQEQRLKQLLVDAAGKASAKKKMVKLLKAKLAS